MPPAAGTLFVVATPIGNLEDITLRALKILKTVQLVAAEDTRRTGNLLRHFGIDVPVISVHEHNEQARVQKIAGRLAKGESVALVTDAGTPGVSDPGAGLVAAMREYVERTRRCREQNNRNGQLVNARLQQESRAYGAGSVESGSGRQFSTRA